MAWKFLNQIDRTALPAGQPVAADYGFLAMNQDPVGVSGGVALPTNGTVYVFKLYTPVKITVTNIWMQVVTAGATLTAGQNFAALYDGNKNLLAATADQSTAWASGGSKTMALTTPQTVQPGFFYVAVWANGTTRPSFGRNGTTAAMNGALSAANARFASADTGRTTTGPATLGSFTAITTAYFVAVT